MKKSITHNLCYQTVLLITMLFCCNSYVKAQGKVQTKTLLYATSKTTGESGLSLVNVDLKWQIVNSFGMINVKVEQTSSINSWGFIYKGTEWLDFDEAKNVRPHRPIINWSITGPGGISKNVNAAIDGIGDEIAILMQWKTEAERDLNNYTATPISVVSMSFENTIPVRNAIDKKIKEDEYNTLMAKGDSEMGQKNYAEAKKFYQKAMYLFPNGRAEVELEKLKLLEEANKKSDKAKSFTAEGDKKFNEGDYEGAERAYNSAKEADPEGKDVPSIEKKMENVKTKKKEVEDKKVDEKAKEAKNLEEKAKEDKLKNEKGANGTSNSDATKEDGTKNKEGAGADKKAETKEAKAAKEKQNIADSEEKERQLAVRRAAYEDSLREVERAQKIERKNEYESQKATQTQANTEVATDLIVQMLMLHIKLGQLIYEDYENETPFSNFNNDSYRLTLNAGYAITSIPFVMNSSVEQYDGDTYSYDNDAENQSSGTLDINGGFKFYPMYGKNMGLSIAGEGGIGHGFLIQSLHSNVIGTVQGYAGFEQMKLFFEYGIGRQSLSKFPWIDSKEFGSQKFNYTYKRIYSGLRISTLRSDDAPKAVNVSIGPVFEQVSYRPYNYVSPFGVRWATGIKLDVDVENRLKFFTEIFPHYWRGGEPLAGYNINYNPLGLYLKIGVYRQFDFFGESSNLFETSVREKMARKQTFNSISYFSPTFNWIVDKSAVRVYSTKSIRLGFQLYYEKDFKIFNKVNIISGLGISLNNGANTYSNGTDSKYTAQSLFIPIGIRYYLENGTMPYKYWVSSTLKNEIELAQNLIGYPNSGLRMYNPRGVFGGGMDYMFSPTLKGRVGLSFDMCLRSIYDSAKTDVRKQSISLNASFIF